MLSACKLYISEGRDQRFVTSLKDLAAKQLGVAFLDAHVDVPYNRTGIVLAANDVSLLAKAASTIAKTALVRLDLSAHVASHPRIGVIDHISCSPLPPSSDLRPSIQLAVQLGAKLGSGADAVPVFLYGHAHPMQSSLADIRRRLGYFKGAGESRWESRLATEFLDDFAPDFGSSHISKKSGVVTIGATPWITNYNILVKSEDLKRVREIARLVSQRGGGIQGIESMALRHTEGIEVACNLSGPSASLQKKVLDTVRELCSSHGIHVLDDYLIGKSPEGYASSAEAFFAETKEIAYSDQQ